MGSHKIFNDPGALLAWLVRLIDVIVIISIALLALVYIDTPNDTVDHHKMVGLSGGVLAYALFPSLGVYRSWRGGGLFSLTGRVILAWLFTLTLILAALYFFWQEQSLVRVWLVSWVGGVAVALVLLRVTLYMLLRYMRKHGLNHRPVLLVGRANAVESIQRRVKDAAWTGYDLIEQIVVPELHDCDGSHDKMYSKVTDIIKNQRVEEVWVAVPLRDENIVRNILDMVQEHPVTIRYAPDIFSLRLLNHSVSEVMGFPMLDLSTTPMVGVSRLVKALEDRVLAFLVLLLVSPLALLIAVAVKLSSPGPVLYKQMRMGWDGSEIKIYKFRSMVVHDEDDEQLIQARRNDPRVTQIGAFLRRTSLDEIPQFFNVLQGRMSIVGPRPHALCHNEQYKGLIDSYMMRHRVKPGITGWAQVNGFRGETDTLDKMKRRVEYDLYYIENWSLWFDMRIILLTVKCVFWSKNAY